MKKPLTRGVAISERLYSFNEDKTDSKIRHSDDLNKLIGRSSLGNPQRDARNLASLLQTMQGGMNTYRKVFHALEGRYGRNFKKIYIQEVHNAKS